MTKKELKKYIENYENNQNEANNLYNKYKEINYNLSANYGQTFSGGDFKNSKIETYIIQKDKILSKIKILEKKIAIVNMAVVVLTSEEKAVIEKIKVFKNQTKLIAKLMDRDKKYIISIREKSLSKMCEYLNSFKGAK